MLRSEDINFSDSALGLTPDNFITYTDQDGLSSNIIYLMVFDNDENLWVGTEKGLDKITLNGNRQITSIKHYGKLEGFAGIETNQNAVFKDQQGNLWFGTIKGVTKYNPKADKINSIEPRTHITGIRLFFENVNWSLINDTSDYYKLQSGQAVKAEFDSITRWYHLPVNLKLPYYTNHLTFDFIGISYKIPEKVKYQFMLEGLDKDWSPVTSKSEAIYSSIRPGKYTFKVISCNNDGVWNQDPDSFSFVITPPFWQTWWFYFFCSIAGISGIFGFIKIREQKLQKAKKILENKVTERTKELSNANKEITAQKADIEIKNKHITSSINYASRIQDSILPDITSLRKFFPDSFVFYKIKDVVSGDFPWFLQKEDDVYVTVVDCTGHGVPGAMLSMIGHFLLKEIIESKKIFEPAQILNHLHIGVNKTLNQDVNIESKDGMDVALCKINLKKMEVEYAGAHRPLLHLRNGDLNEIKGDRMPIGGTQYSRKGKEMIFTNHLVKISKGDAIYFYSDGLTDQFGGPDTEERKFMSSRVREVILSSKEKPMDDIGKLFEMKFEGWMGNSKQIDDVLFIGIRF